MPEAFLRNKNSGAFCAAECHGAVECAIYRSFQAARKLPFFSPADIELGESSLRRMFSYPRVVMPTPRISVLLPAYNEGLLIAKTLESVHSSFAAIAHASYEIVVCDNNSTDDTAKIAGAKGARVVFEPHNQIARARNTAARAASGKWFIFLDADTSVNPGVLDATIRTLESGKVCGGGAMLAFDRAKPGLIATSLVRLWNGASVVLNLAAGSYLFCLQEAWHGVGGFDESYYACEELVFSRRLKRWGKAHGLSFKIQPTIRVVTSARKVERYGQWKLLFKFFLMARPNATRSRKTCDLWYSRPR